LSLAIHTRIRIHFSLLNRFLNWKDRFERMQPWKISSQMLQRSRPEGKKNFLPNVCLMNKLWKNSEWYRPFFKNLIWTQSKKDQREISVSPSEKNSLWICFLQKKSEPERVFQLKSLTKLHWIRGLWEEVIYDDLDWKKVFNQPISYEF